ncbi:MAG: glycogen/starch synthase [Prevotellaceae bacterium]|jgi:starch synthase|nr:glycogen/starch synthase [Prevotellaceae bacterium]
MKNAKILFVCSEIAPYLPENDISTICRQLPQTIQEMGNEIRTFVPHYGCINDRRHQLHEVIRLSGINLIIDDNDHPLLIKVASISAARMQVYFIDNEDFFRRKYLFADDAGIPFADNDERAIFYARGVLETVKKLQWIPDIIHCHGWFTYMVPLFLKIAYKDDIIKSSKIVLSLYNDKFEGIFSNALDRKLISKNIKPKHIETLMEKPDYEHLVKFAVDYSDGIIFGTKKIGKRINEYIRERENEKPILEYQDIKGDTQNYANFYEKILQKHD